MLNAPQEEPLFARSEVILTKEVEGEISAARERVLGEIDRLNLWRAVGELDMRGFTVIPPEDAAPAGFAAAVREALLEVSEQESGVRPDADSGATHKDILTRHGSVELIEPLIHMHPIFQDALLNEPALALVTYLLGESCGLISSTGQIKGPGEHYLPLHADVGLTRGPGPFSLTADVCNAVWVLSDYSADNGATCIVPGSHKLCRNPNLSEIKDMSLYKALDIKAGSILVWHGNTWHGAVPRRSPGLRLGIIQYFGRWFLNRGHLAANFTEKEIARRPPRFARLIGAPGSNSLSSPPAAYFSQFG
jgi:ectoine hydroxylase-related dioxygenase (phytanoyl-CoA dioxygenase family)